MFTVCPKCAMTLTVTAADLRVAQGFVRCGRCTNVFNALVALSDERQPPPPAPGELVAANDTATQQCQLAAVPTVPVGDCCPASAGALVDCPA